MAKRRAPERVRFIPQERTQVVQYIEAGSPDDALPFEATVRTSLTIAEINALTWEDEEPITDVHERFAPYVIGWNLGALGADGDVVDLPPPAEAGGDAFQHLPNGIFRELVRDIKLRSQRVLDPKLRAPSEPTPEPSNADGSTA